MTYDTIVAALTSAGISVTGTSDTTSDDNVSVYYAGLDDNYQKLYTVLVRAPEHDRGNQIEARADAAWNALRAAGLDPVPYTVEVGVPRGSTAVKTYTEIELVSTQQVRTR